MERKIFKIAILEPVIEPIPAVLDVNSSALDSQGVMAKAISKFAPSKRKSKNLIPVTSEEFVTDKNTSILFVLLPEWAKNFPPYNIARLAALTKLNGYYENWYKDWSEKLNTENFN
jgi:hypothetical protein